jgi:magnesium transporter
MLNKYCISAGRLTESQDASSIVWIYTAPTMDERKDLTENFKIDEHTLASALDL